MGCFMTAALSALEIKNSLQAAIDDVDIHKMRHLLAEPEYIAYLKNPLKTEWMVKYAVDKAHALRDAGATINVDIAFEIHDLVHLAADKKQIILRYGHYYRGFELNAEGLVESTVLNASGQSLGPAKIRPNIPPVHAPVRKSGFDARNYQRLYGEEMPTC